MIAKPTIAFVNQPWGHIEPPVRGGGSIPIVLYELARRMTEQARLLYYVRGRFLPHHKIVEEIDYRYIPMAADKVMLKVLDRLPLRENPVRPRFAWPLVYQGYGLQAAISLRMQRADVIHLHNITQFVPVVRFFNPRAIIVLQMHCEWLSQLDQKMIRKRLRHVDLIVGVSDFITNLVRKRFPEFADRCRTLYNGVDVETFRERPEPAVDAPPRKIVYVGRISPEKGVHVLLDAFAQIAGDYPDVSLDLVGPDEINPPELVVPLTDDVLVRQLLPWYSSSAYRAVLEKLITPQIRDRVRFVGNVRHGALLAEAYSKGDVCAIPSVWEEPFGIPVVEAMACGVPVVATRGGAFPELVEDGKSGLLVERASATDLARGLRRLLADGKLRRDMGRAARQRAVNVFSWDQAAKTALSYYRSVHGELGRARASSAAHGRAQPEASVRHV
jgi:spore coat protein SA